MENGLFHHHPSLVLDPTVGGDGGGSVSSITKKGKTLHHEKITMIHPPPYDEYPASSFIYPNLNRVNQITEPFCLIVMVLKILGNSPITSETILTTRSTFRIGTVGQKILRGPKLRFFINWTDPWTIFSALLAIYSMIVWAIFFINFGLGIPFLIAEIISQAEFNAIIEDEESSKNHLGGIIRKTYLITSSIMIIETMARWRHARKFILFLSRWEKFDKLLADNFPAYDYAYDFSSVTKFRDTLILFYVVYPSMILVPAFLIVYASRLSLLGKLLAIQVCFGFIVISLVEDVKVILSYKAIQQAFYQVRLLLTYHSEQKVTVTSVKAHDWRQLIQFIRSQAELVGRYQKFEELARMVAYIALVTLFIFIILNGWEHARQRGDMVFMFSCCGYSGMLMTRLYFKAVMAEEITHEEHHLAKVVLAMDSKSWDSRTMLEIKTLVDAIALKPARICFGNYVVLNKRLLLGISSQVVTYLIVLMQFSEPLPLNG